MDYALVVVTAFLVAGLTLFSGFGLGTALMPAFALYFPVQTAIAATAVVHLANNLFKLVLVGRHADWGTVLRFGLPAAVAAVGGALVLALFSDLPPLASYRLGGRVYEIVPVKAVIGTLILIFAALDLHPRFAELAIPPRYVVLGGLLSGFFGGLSGNQGALRSAFLINAGLGKEAFVGTSAVAAVMVDTVRLAVYGLAFVREPLSVLRSDTAGLVAAATAAAFLGSYLGARMLKTVTLGFIRVVVALMMAAVGIGLIAGLL